MCNRWNIEIAILQHVRWYEEFLKWILSHTILDFNFF